MQELEELSIRARRGDLNPEERRAFERAVATAAPARLFHRMGCDFDLELRVRPGDDELIRRVSQRALASSRSAVVNPIRTMTIRLSLALLVTCSTAGAAAWIARGRSSPRTIDVPPEARQLEKLNLPRSLSASAVQSRSRISMVAPTTARATGPSGLDVREPKLTRTEVRTASEPLDAAALFRGANAARRSGDMQTVESLYRELQSRFPDSEQARISHIAFGKLLLLAGRATDAQRQFEMYLAQGSGPLEQEAMAGRAEIFSRLGERRAEARAWQDLLRRHPSSVQAARATERLRELGLAGDRP